MTREKEDELLAQRRELRNESKRMIQRIVQARLGGTRDDEAIDRLASLSCEEVEMTTPDFTLAA